MEYSLATIAPYEALRDAGASPVEVWQRAASDGIKGVYLAAIMRDVFGMMLDEALEVRQQANAMKPPA